MNGRALLHGGDQLNVAFSCNDEDLAAVGMACSDDDPCPIYLELSGISALGKKLSLAGNLHGASATLYSVLLTSDDAGATWTEPAARIPGAALEQVQLFDATHSWAAGETQVPLARDPFFLIASDGGASWRKDPVSEDGAAGAIQKFWFDSEEHGELIVDGGRTASGGRYLLYETHTGGASWNVVSKTAQVPRLRRAPVTGDEGYRIGTDNKSRAFVIEKREGEAWKKVASFSVQVASCGTRHLPPPVEQAEPEVPVQAQPQPAQRREPPE
jgi:photosystem II stability/assembly factor-like uncharacterized protein